MTAMPEKPREAMQQILRDAIEKCSDEQGCFKLEEVIAEFEANYFPAMALVRLCEARNELLKVSAHFVRYVPADMPAFAKVDVPVSVAVMRELVDARKQARAA